MKTITKMLAGAALAVVVLVLTAASLVDRNWLTYHLKVQPPSTSEAATNVAEFVSAYGTNSVVITTNVTAAGVGPRLAVRIGTNVYYAVTNTTVYHTNGTTLGVIRNGILCEN